MTSLFVEQFDMPASAREAMAIGAAWERASEVLAGRTVWCATALPDARRSADALRAGLDGAGPGVAATDLQLSAAEPLRELAGRVERMLAGAWAEGSPELGQAERNECARGAVQGDALIGERVAAEDVVVVHDALGAVVAQAVREHGAHLVWRFRVAGGRGAAGHRAFDFLRCSTPGVDAYVMAWFERGHRGEVVERVAAAMPSAGILATKQFPLRFAGHEPRRLAWTMALAEVVRSDREECVGGTLHPRPSVAAR
jgi:hypothetical protein